MPNSEFNSPRDREQSRTPSTPVAYKNHNIGSRKGEAHRLYDQLGPEKARPLILKMGISKGTIHTWFGSWRAEDRAAAAQPPAVKGGGDAR
jgi:hypothetical protein